MSANTFAIWARPDSVPPPVKIPSAERRAYSTPVAPPTGEPSAANLPTFGIVKLILDGPLSLACPFFSVRSLELNIAIQFGHDEAFDMSLLLSDQHDFLERGYLAIVVC